MKLRFRPNQPTWWIWLSCAVALTFGLAGFAAGYSTALLLAAAQAGVFCICDGAWTLPVQIRVAYVPILFAGQIPGLRVLTWMAAGGTFLLVFFDYCPLARFLSLCPWNRREPLTFALIRRTFLRAPCPRSPILSCEIEPAFSQTTNPN